jgi:hypothetical protein
LLKSEPTASDAERDRDDEPDNHDDEHGGEGHSARGSTAPDEEVEEEKDGKDKTRECEGRANEAKFPGLAMEELIGSGSNVAADEAEQCVEDNDDSAERAAVAG